jgi:hypothetical protein
MSEEQDQAVEPQRAAEVVATDAEGLLDDPARRTFLKRAALGGGAALAAGTGAYKATMVSLEGRVLKDFPEVDEAVFKPKDQRDQILTFAYSKKLNEEYPERTPQYQKLHDSDFEFLGG